MKGCLFIILERLYYPLSPVSYHAKDKKTKNTVAADNTLQGEQCHIVSTLTVKMSQFQHSDDRV